MRKELVELLKKAIVFEYLLPKDGQVGSVISTANDHVFGNPISSDLSLLIYNSIVDLAYEETDIVLTKLNELQREALLWRIKYDDDIDSIRNGFFGETVLNVMLRQYFNTDVLIARGRFYDPLSDMEAHGFDSHHFVVRNNRIELWCGEVKFYQKYGEAIVKIVKNLNKNLSSQYLSRNFIHIINHSYPLATTNNVARDFMEQIKSAQPKTIIDLLTKYAPKVVYPVLVICNQQENIIEKCIAKIKEEVSKINFLNEIDASIFFIFLPVNNASDIKKEVIKWIKTNKPLI